MGRERLFLGCAALLFAAYTAALFVDAVYDVFVDTVYHLPWMFALCLAPWTIRRAAGRERLAWVLLTVMIACWGVAELTYTFYPTFTGEEAPFPGPAEPLYFTGYIALAASITCFATAHSRRNDNRGLLDGLTLFIVLGTISYQVIVHPLANSTEGGLSAVAAAVAYPLLDLAVMTALLMSIYISRSRARWPLYAISLAVVASFIGDTGYLWLTLYRPDAVFALRLLDLVWLTNYTALAFAFLTGLRMAASERSLRGLGETRGALALPYLALVPLGALAATWLATGNNEFAVLAAGTLAAAGVMLARQWLTLAENLHLREELAVQVQQRTHAIEKQELLVEQLEAKAIELERAREEAVFLAEHDGLTGLLNHRAWFRQASHLRPASMAVFDIDHFKRINDSQGHPAGDEVLRRVADRLAAELGDRATLGRLGGEEFGALFACGPAEAEQLCAAVVDSLAAVPIVLPGRGAVSVTVSAGLAGWVVTSGSEESVERTYEAADRALYEAKAAGRSRLRVAA